MNKRFILTAILLMTAFGMKSYSQHYRLSMALTLKEKNDSIEALYIGKLYYDLNQKLLIYRITFPDTQQWFLSDTAMMICSNHKVIKKLKIKTDQSVNIFQMILTGSLNTFSMQKNPYKLKETRSEQGMNILVYSPKSKKSQIGDIALAYKNKLLESVVIYQPNKKAVAYKQFFKKYVRLADLQIPSEYYQISYINKIENIKKYHFKDIKIDEEGNDSLYRLDNYLR